MNIKNLLYRNIYIKKSNTYHSDSRITNGSRILIDGTDCSISIGNNVTMNNMQIAIRGNKSNVVIGDNCSFDYGVTVKVNNGNLIIGNNTTLGAYCSIMCFDGTIEIGEDCMFSRYVHIRNSDGHTIKNKNGFVINENLDVMIEKHVWIGHGAILLKGAKVNSGCAIGAGTIVTGKEYMKDCIYAGNPAQLIKEEITWER